MKVLLIGHGWVATKMAAALREHTVIRRTHETAIAYLQGIEPRTVLNWVVNCAGYTGVPNVDNCEEEKALTIEANTVFPLRLLAQCEKWKDRLFHFSSGCIFRGGIFDEQSQPNFYGSIYSASKLASDVAMSRDAVVARIRMPFDGGWGAKNLLTKLEKYARNGKILDGFNSISFLDEMCEHAVKLMEDGADNGVYHLVNQGAIWTHEIMKMLGVENVTYWDRSEFAKAHAAPRSECVLNTALPTLEVHEALYRAIERRRMAA